MDAAQGTDGALAKRHRDADAQYLDLKGLCVRLSLSRRTVRSFINNPTNPLPAYKCGGGKLLCKWTEVERWIRRHRVRDAGWVPDGLVSEILGAVKDGQSTQA